MNQRDAPRIGILVSDPRRFLSLGFFFIPLVNEIIACGWRIVAGSVRKAWGRRCYRRFLWR